jgi:hypothetical protein
MEIEENGQKSKSGTATKDEQKRSLLYTGLFVLAANIFGNFDALRGGSSKSHFLLLAISAPIIVFCIAVSLFEEQIDALMRWTIGAIGHVQVSSPELERKIRDRYRQEIRQLEFVGFNFLFAEGETFQLIRFLFGFPALIALTMRAKQEVLAIHNGRDFLAGHPIFASADKTAFGHPNGLGVKFHTVFNDGTILVTKNYGDSSGYAPIAVVQPMIAGAQISDMCAVHQRGIEELKTAGKRVDNPISFQAYADVSHRETAISA